MRQPADIFPRSVEVIAVSDLTRPVEWRPLLRDVDTVVHLAGIAHAGPEIAEQAYDRVNRLATAELAGAAKTMGIKHLVFMSSIRAQSGPASDSDSARDRRATADRRLWTLQACRRGRRARRRRAVHDPAAGIDLWSRCQGQFRAPDGTCAKTVAAAARPLPQPPIAAGAAKPDRRHSLCGGVIRGQKRNLRRGGS